MVRSSGESLGTVGQGRFDDGLEGCVGRVAPVGDVLVLDLAPDRLDRLQFGAGGRQEPEVDARGLQVWQRRLDRLAVVNRVVVQHNHARECPVGGHPARQSPDEGQVGGGSMSSGPSALCRVS